MKAHLTKRDFAHFVDVHVQAEKGTSSPLMSLNLAQLLDLICKDSNHVELEDLQIFLQKKAAQIQVLVCKEKPACAKAKKVQAKKVKSSKTVAL